MIENGERWGTRRCQKVFDMGTHALTVYHSVIDFVSSSTLPNASIRFVVFSQSYVAFIASYIPLISAFSRDARYARFIGDGPLKIVGCAVVIGGDILLNGEYLSKGLRKA